MKIWPEMEQRTEQWFRAQPGNIVADALLGGYIPAPNSPALGNGLNVSNFIDPWFDNVDYIGAFDGENDWTVGWTFGLHPEPAFANPALSNVEVQAQREALSAAATSSEGKSVMLGLPDLDETVEALRNVLFLRLNPEAIGNLQSIKRSGGRIRLTGDGANVAEYLIDLRERSASAFEEVTYALQYVLPYATDVEPKVLDAGILRRSYVQLLEDRYEIPGWLMSSGSLRVLPLIATLLDPDPPPVLFIEEVENGLDPRTVGLVVDLMRAAAQSGRTQVIATTHSPYLLDMLDLDDVLLCERGDKGPAFSWPASRKEMKAWRDKFMPGRLYTMNALQRESAASSEVVPSTQGEAPEGGWGDSE